KCTCCSIEKHLKLHHSLSTQRVEHDEDKYYPKKIHCDENGDQTEKFQCPHCSKVYDSKLPAERHVRKHIHIFYCNPCQMSFGSFKEWNHHKTQNHMEPIHICEHCGVQYKNKRSLNRHMETHRFGDFICEICNRTFSSSQCLRVHKDSVHQLSKRVLSCDQCQKVFYQNNKFKSHILSHSKPFICSYCGQRFGYKKYLD
ncbi:unnamed protein product, partial [Owenia fusiformis]